MSGTLSGDVERIKPFAEQVAELAAGKRNRLRIERCSSVNEGRTPDSPPITIMLDESAWQEVVPDANLICVTPQGRAVEKNLRRTIYLAATGDDTVVYDSLMVDPVIDVDPPNIYGVDCRVERPAEKDGAYRIEHPLKEHADLKKLVMPEFTYNRKVTEEKLSLTRELLGGILTAELSSDCRISALMNGQADQLRGIMELMVDMMDSPAFVHDLMEYLTQIHLRSMKTIEDAGIIVPGPRSIYYAGEPFGPAPVNGRYGYKNRWIRMHGQEFDQISPDMCAEFLLPYQKRIAALYGKVEYGCCENLTRKVKDVMTIPNVAIVACSPYSDMHAIADAVGQRAVIQWRQRPADLLYTDDLSRIQDTLRKGFDVFGECRLHIALREIMTFNGKFERLNEFVIFARELAAKARC